MFPMTKAWMSKKPIKYWRALTPRDIPTSNDPPLNYYEWNNNKECWDLNTINPSQRHWSYQNIKTNTERINKIIMWGWNEMAIVEVHPKFKVGKYKNGIEVLEIYSENAQFNSTKHTYKIYETEYYIKQNNRVHFVTEDELYEMINADRNCYSYVFKSKKAAMFNRPVYISIFSNTTNPKKEKAFILNALSKPGLKFHFPHHPTFFYNDSENQWEYVSTSNISKKLWNIFGKNCENQVEYNADRDKKQWCMYYNFIGFREYYKEQVAKVKSANILDDLDLAFLKAIKAESRNKKANRYKNSHSVGTNMDRKASYNIKQAKNLNRETPEFVYVIYKTPQQQTVARKCTRAYAEKLQGRHPGIKILTLSELRSNKVKDQKEVKHPEGSYNRRLRRLTKQKQKHYSRNVEVQHIYVPSKEVAENFPKIATAPWRNQNGHEHKALFITKNNITGSVIKVNGKLVAKDFAKLIYHHVRPTVSNITRHDLKKQSERPMTHRQIRLKELRDKYSSYDRRYTTNSDVEKWSLQFFIVLKMIKDKERRKKVISYLIKCGYSNEFANGFIEYLQLTKNGDPIREHKRNHVRRYERIMVTKPHVKIYTPEPYKPIVIEHEIKDEVNGGVKNIITENVHTVYNKKEGLRFYTYNIETNEHTLIARAKDVKKWAYVHEYDADSNKTKWRELIEISEKQVPKVIKTQFTLERRLVGGKPKKWVTPIPQEKTVQYVIKKMNMLYKAKEYRALYSLIYNTVMEYYRADSPLYDAIRFALYHNYSDLSKSLVTLIKVNKMDDPDLVTFMEDLMHPHFN